MLEQWNNLQCECWNNAITYNANVGTMEQLTMRIWDNETAYNANVGKLEQLTMRMLENWNNLQSECWNNGTTYNANVGKLEQLTMRMLAGWRVYRRRVSGKYGVGRANMRLAGICLIYARRNAGDGMHETYEMWHLV